MREFWRIGITNFGAGCRVHCGWIEFAEVCRANVGRFCGGEVAAVTEVERMGAGTLLLGGMAGGGPLVVAVMELWVWILGGIWGSLALSSSPKAVDLEVILEVLWSIAEVAFDIDCAIELCVSSDWVGTADIAVVGFCGETFTIWGWTCDWIVLPGDLMGVRGEGCDSEKNIYLGFRLLLISIVRYYNTCLQRWVMKCCWFLMFENILSAITLFLFLSCSHVWEHT